MPPLETMDRTDRAVLWAFARWQGDGEPVVSSPVDVTVDWSWDKRDGRAPDGTRVSYDATAYTDRAVAVGSLMTLGCVRDLPAGTAQDDQTDLYQVVGYGTDKDLKGRTRHRAHYVTLARFRGALCVVTD